MPAWKWQNETFWVRTIRDSLSWLKRRNKFVDSFYKTPADAPVRFHVDRNQEGLCNTPAWNSPNRETLFLRLSPAFACKHITTVNTQNTIHYGQNPGAQSQLLRWGWDQNVTKILKSKDEILDSLKVQTERNVTVSQANVKIL